MIACFRPAVEATGNGWRGFAFRGIQYCRLAKRAATESECGKSCDQIGANWNPIGEGSRSPCGINGTWRKNEKKECLGEKNSSVARLTVIRASGVLDKARGALRLLLFEGTRRAQ
jgi:hypothetical protein